MAHFSRRDMLKSIAATGLGVAGLAGGETSSPSLQETVPDVTQRGDRLNVILIILDTARRDRFTFHGYPRDTTPFLERFARRAVLYDRAYSPSNWTVPAHGSLFTGLYPAWHGALSHKKLRISPDLPTVPELLKRVGYQTINITGNKMVSNGRAGRGFAEEHLLLEEYPFSPLDSRSSIAYPMAAAWLTKKRDPERPFFMYINSLEPHDRYDTLAYPMLRRFLTEDVEVDELCKDWKRRKVFNDRYRNTRYATPYTARDLDLTRRFYDANIAYLDSLLERFIDHLYREMGAVMDRTVLIITSDHGEMLGEHGLVTHHGGMYQELCRIPLLVKYPGASMAPGRCKAPVSLIDFPATLAEMLGLDWDKRDLQQGVSWVGTLPSERILYMEDGRPPYGSEFKPKHMNYHYMRAILEGNHKYVWYNRGKPQLFDVEKDRREANNLAASMPAMASRLQDTMKAFFENAPFGPNRKPASNRTREDEEALEALGYI